MTFPSVPIRAITALAASVLAIIYAAERRQPPRRPPSLEMTARDLMGEATDRTLPEYPSWSLWTQHQGVAVADVDVDESGRVTSAAILEAPDRWIASAFLRAAKQWRFKTPLQAGTGTSQAQRGRLIGYFVIKDGVGVVTLPVDGTAGPSKRAVRKQ